MNLISKRKYEGSPEANNSLIQNSIASFKSLDIGTAQIKDASITNAKIVTLEVSKLTAGTMTADVTISNTFQTAASPNARLTMTSTGIKAYDSTNTQRVQILNDGSGWFGSSTAFKWTTAGAVTFATTSTHKITAGGGAVTLDNNGITVQANYGGVNYIVVQGSSGSGGIAWKDTTLNKYGAVQLLPFGDLLIYSPTGYGIQLSANGSVTVSSVGRCIYMDARFTRFAQYTADPASPQEGYFYYNTAMHFLRYYNGSGWVTM